MSTFVSAFERACLEAPHRVAVVDESNSISYQQLHELTLIAACRLVEAGVAAGDSVGLLCTRSSSTLVAMLACLRVRAVFVPIEPAYPDQRIRYMLDDARVGVLMHDDELAERAWLLAGGNDTDCQLLGALVDRVSATARATTTQAMSVEAGPLPDPQDRAYIMYTSGSTGQPKGVPISHAALHCYCKADASAYGLTPSDRTLQFSTLSFDIAIEEIFPPLMTGGAVVMRPSRWSEAQIELSEIIERHAVTAIHLATAYWHEWVDLMLAVGARVPATLRLMVVTGEKVSPEHYQRWLSLLDHEVLWANAYGPTETTVSATVFVPPPGWQGSSLPIGKPLPGYSALILDESMQAVLPGVTGELYIGGEALAEGYLNRPDQTAQAFVADPRTGRQGQRLYRTGDLARWLDDGNIEYAGRVDHQIKMGGFRIEPGEIENAISTHPMVKDVLVSARAVAGKDVLVAHVAHGDDPLTAYEVAEHLTALLPAYLLPARYLLIDALPKTVNGKLDRDALPPVSQAVHPAQSAGASPVTPLQTALHAIWCEVLGVDDIGVDDGFTVLGGDSLAAVRVIARVQAELGHTISTRDFFMLDTIELLASHLEGTQVVRRIPAPTPSFIDSRQRQLYTVLQAANPVRDCRHGVLLVPPLGNEQRRVQRPWRSLMRDLSRNGYTSLRFDWQGTGNSSGNSDALTSLDAWRDDIHDAAQALLEHSDQIDLVAVRAGTLLAASCPLDGLAIRHRYYCDPVTDGATWIQDMRELHGGVLRDGYRFLHQRRARKDDLVELTGVLLQPAVCQQIQALSLGHAMEHHWNREAQIITSADDVKRIEAIAASVHVVEQRNDWLDPRATTEDLAITAAARVVFEQLPGSARSSA